MTKEQLEIVVAAMADKITALEEKNSSLETQLYLRDYEIAELKKKVEEKKEN